MTNVQLDLFEDDYCYRAPSRKISRVEKKADLILDQLKDESLDVQRGVVCELFYLNICKTMDKMPGHYTQSLIVKLIERYLTGEKS